MGERKEKGGKEKQGGKGKNHVQLHVKKERKRKKKRKKRRKKGKNRVLEGRKKKREK